MDDSHAHLTSHDMVMDLDGVISRAKRAGVNRIVNVNTSLEELYNGIAIADRHRGYIYNSVATIPHVAHKVGKRDIDLWRDFAMQGKVSLIGESGLDYYYFRESKDIQGELLRAHADIAREVGVPLMLHCRGEGAFDDIFAILKDDNRVLVHCFTGSDKDAKEAISRGWILSLSGILTWEESNALREVVSKLPIDHLLIETDSPYLAPERLKGNPNEPAYLPDTFEMLSEITAVDKDLLSKTLSKTLTKLLTR